MKYIITESQYNRVIDKFLTRKFEPHEEKTSKEYPNSIFWVKDGKVILEIENSNKIWVLGSIWDLASDLFELDYDETKLVINHWLEEHYELGGLTTRIKKANKYQWERITL